MKLITLTSQQQDIYHESLLYPATPVHNIGAKIAIRGPLHIQSLRKAYVALIDQHDSFRGSIITTGKVHQFGIADEWHAPLGWLDFSSHPDPDAAATQYMQQEFVKPFNLNECKVLHRFCLIKVENDFHYLFSVYHHIITDGWGTSLMFQRLISNYNEIMATGEVRTEYPFFYENYVADEITYNTSTTFEEDSIYWRTQFNTLPDPVIPRKDNTTFVAVSRREELILKRELYNRLNNLATSYKVSTFHMLLGVLAVYLGRCYHTSDLVIGLPVLNRDKAWHKKTVGLFMGVSPLRIGLSWEESFEELTVRIRQQLRQDYRHQRFPMGRLLQGIGVVQEKHRLYNVAVSYEKHNYADAFTGTRTSVIPLTHNAERAALAIYVREFSQEEDVRLDFDYNLHYFDPQSMQRLTGHYHALLEAVLLEDGRKLKDLCLLTSREEEEILCRFNPVPVTGAGNHIVTTLVAEQVDRVPYKTALWDENISYSYKELQEVSDNIARVLSAMGRKPVAVMMDRSAKMVVLLLAILKSGRSYIPLDPSFPAARLLYILENSRTDILIYEQDNIEWQLDSIQLLSYGSLMHQTGISTEDVKLPLLTQEDTAYIIYTSGSTGNPKGVEVSHRALANFLVSMQSRPGLCEDDILFSVTSQSFDISILEFFLPLITGAAAYIADRETLFDPRKTIEKLKQINPTIMQATPGFYQLLFNAGWEGSDTLTILCGGDLLSTVLAEKLLQHASAVWNMYGPTETTIWSAVKRVLQPEDSSNIGRPINNTVIYILDACLKPLPVGVTGDIYIGGMGVAKGYYHQELLTREKFIISPFDENQRIYFTGDIGRWNEQGEIIFGGRSDTQVKVRGYRIELEEIEKKMTDLPDIDEAVVVARKGDNQDAFLIGFVKTSNRDFIQADVITALEAILPDYMIPQLIVPLTVFPLTPNQKVDRRSLAAWNISAMHTEETLHTPTRPVERLLAALWKRTLGVTTEDKHSNFFRLGGHSIKAMELANYINEHFDSGVGLKDIFENPTIEKQAELLSARRNASIDVIPLTLPAIHYEVAPVQRMIWLACQRPVISAAYNMDAIFSVAGHFNPTAMEMAVQQIINRHEILRTNFIEVAGVPRQKIQTGDNPLFNIQQVEIAHSEDVDAFVADIVTTPFDLESELLLKAFLIRIADGRQLFVFITHHLILDGWSLEIFVKEVLTAYRGILHEKMESLSPLPFQYRDYAVWSNNRLQEPASRLCITYWQEVLRDFVPVETFKRTGNEQSFCGNKIYTDLGQTISNSLYAKASEMDMSVFNMLLAAVHALIGRVAKQYDFCTGIPVAGRGHPQLQDLLGMFVNTILIRSQLTMEDSFESICHHVKEAVFQSMDYQDLPLDELMNIRREKNTMLFDVMVTWQHPDFNMEELKVMDDLVLSRNKFTQGGSRIPVTFNFYENGEQLICETVYDTGLFEEGQMMLITERFRKLLQQMISQPQAPLNTLDIELELEKELRHNSVEIEFEF